MNSIKWDPNMDYEEILSEVSKDKLWEFLQSICSYERETGSGGEREALDYIQKAFQSYDIPYQLLKFDAFIGLPEQGEIEILGSNDKIIRGRPPAFSIQTPEEGIEAEVVDGGCGTIEELKAIDVRGKFVLVGGLATPSPARLIEDLGAVGQIYINSDNIRDFAISPIWGTPTPETAHLIPKSHVLSILGSDGDRIKCALRNGQTFLRMKVRSFVGWRKAQMLVAHIQGTLEPHRYAMLGGHLDSWYYGAYDNGAANAAMLEIARIVNCHRNKLRRGLKIAFWTGHSQGRYAGSTWFADNFWEDLHAKCVGIITADMAGYKGATDYTRFPRLGVTKACGNHVVFKITGQESFGVPFDHTGDQSFWGIGIPSLFNVISRPTETQSDSYIEKPGSAPRGLCWHSVHDNIDQVDPNVLAKDTRVVLLAVCYFCMNNVLPLNFVDASQEIVSILKELNESFQGRFPLDSSIHKAEVFLEQAKALHHIVSEVKLEEEKKVDVINRIFIRLSRIIVPIVQTFGNAFDHDPALPMKLLPSLQSIRKLANLDQLSDEARFLKTRLVRERNRIENALLEAGCCIETGLREMNDDCDHHM